MFFTARQVAPMTPRTRWAAALLLLPAAAALADYRIDWHAIHGGGGVSTAAGTTLAGTIGQPSPGYSDGGGYRLSAGFWLAAPPVADPIFSDGFEGGTP